MEEAEGMIVGAVRRESECSWPDACDAWAALDEETEAGVHQVGVGEMETEQGGGDEREETSRVDQEDEQFETEGLLVEGEEREYVLELLMRETPLKMRASVHPANAKSATFKGKRKRNLEKKLHKRARMAREAAVRGSGKDGRRVTDGGGEKQVTLSTPRNPETKGGGVVGGERGRRDQPTTSLPTSGGKCSA